MFEKREMRRKKLGLDGFHRLWGGEEEKERDRRVKGLRERVEEVGCLVTTHRSTREGTGMAVILADDGLLTALSISDHSLARKSEILSKTLHSLGKDSATSIVTEHIINSTACSIKLLRCLNRRPNVQVKLKGNGGWLSLWVAETAQGEVVGGRLHILQICKNINYFAGCRAR